MSPSERRRGRYWRRGDEPEFGRILYFSDAVYAIALTLLALDLRVSHLSGDESAPATMLAALDDLIPKLIAFAVGFALLARYWLAHHDFMSRLSALDSRLITLNLVYLAFVALLPFPTAMIGEFESNPISGVVFAATLSVISLLETLMLAHAHRARLMRERLTPDESRYELIGSLQPAVMFLVTIPLAFINPTVMLVSWLVVGPVAGWLISRRSPTADAASSG